MTPIRFSALKYFAKSAAHYRHYCDNPPEQSRPMRLGSAVDALRFGYQRVAVSECATRRGKAWDVFAEDNADAILLTPSENDVVLGMVRSLSANPEACRLLQGATQERIEWTMAGRLCSGTPDAAGDSVTDLKTTRNAHPIFFQYDARKMAYHAQLDWYMNGLELSGRPKPRTAHIVAVENVAPYVVTIFQVSERALLEGRKLWSSWFEQLLVCEASNVWPGYAQAVTQFDVPDSESLTLQIDGEEVDV